RTRTRRVACSTTARTYIRVPVRVTASKKSAAMMASAWERKNAAHVCDVRCGAGSMPASLRISHTVEAATLTPRTSSSPWMRARTLWGDGPIDRQGLSSADFACGGCEVGLDGAVDGPRCG